LRFRSIAKSAALIAALIVALGAQASELSPDDLIKGGHWKRAKALLEPRVQASPNDGQALYLLSQVRMAYRDYQGALALAERAAAQNPKNAEYRGQVAEAVCELAGKERSFSLGRRCKSELEATAALDPNDLDSRWGLMQWHMEAPWIIGGRKDEARKRLAEIQRINPSRGAMAQVRMNHYDNKTDSPEPLYLKALELDPQSYSIRTTLMSFYISDAQKRFDLAEKYARELLKLEPNRTGGYTGLAIVFARQKRWQELDAVLAQAEKAVPDSFVPFLRAAQAIPGDSGEQTRAEKYFRKYLSIEPEPNSPTLADAHWMLALLLERMNRKPEAINELKMALQLNPDHEAAKKDLKRLS
jgi:tetratricopeptide (TPR) repeat protein